MAHKVFLLDSKANVPGRWSSKFLDLFPNEFRCSDVEKCFSEIDIQQDRCSLSRALIFCHIHDAGKLNHLLNSRKGLAGAARLYFVFFSGGGIAEEDDWVEFCRAAMDEGVLDWAGVLHPPIEGNQKVVMQFLALAQQFQESCQSREVKEELQSILMPCKNPGITVFGVFTLLQGFMVVADLNGKAARERHKEMLCSVAAGRAPWRDHPVLKEKWSFVSKPIWWRKTFEALGVRGSDILDSISTVEAEAEVARFLNWVYQGLPMTEPELVDAVSGIVGSIAGRK